MYAEDFVIFANSTTAKPIFLFGYCKTWKMKVNTLKNELMIFKRSMLQRNLEIQV